MFLKFNGLCNQWYASLAWLGHRSSARLLDTYFSRAFLVPAIFACAGRQRESVGRHRHLTLHALTLNPYCRRRFSLHYTPLAPRPRRLRAGWLAAAVKSAAAWLLNSTEPPAAAGTVHVRGIFEGPWVSFDGYCDSCTTFRTGGPPPNVS